MNGAVSSTQVRRVSCGLIPDQTQKTDTIISNIMGYFFDDMRYLLPTYLFNVYGQLVSTLRWIKLQSAPHKIINEHNRVSGRLGSMTSLTSGRSPS
jgi:hypothetical protein